MYICASKFKNLFLSILILVGILCTPQIATAYVFNSQISFGSTNNDVIELQKFLKDKGFYNYAITGYFGDVTKRAVQSFQKANGIASEKIDVLGYGKVGQKTLSALNKLADKSTVSELRIGSKGNEVRELQLFLNKNGFPVAFAGPGSPGNETSVFGIATQNALKRFQASNRVVSSGILNPVTREIVRSYQTSNLARAGGTPASFQVSYANTSYTRPSFTNDLGSVVVPDTTSPVVSVTAPSNNAIVSGSSITVSASSSDDVSVSGVQFKLDTNTNLGSEDIASPYAVTWDSTAVADGVHSIVAVARDDAGNYATSSVISVTVDNSGPVITSASSTSITYNSALIGWNTDELSSSTVTYGTSSGVYTMSTSSADLVTTHALSLTGLSASTQYYYVVVSADALGHVSTSTQKTFTTENTLAGIYSTKVLSYSPIAYWPLTETTGSTAVNSQGVTARNGTYTGVSLAQSNLAETMPAPYFDGTNDYVNIYSTSLRDAFNGSEGTMIVTGVVDPQAWIDGQFRRLAILRVNSSNRVSIYKSNEVNKITYMYNAGGTSEQLIHTVSDVSAKPIQLGISWSKTADRVKFFFNGTVVGTSTALGTFSGSLADAWIGSDSITPTLPWKGSAGQVAVFGRELTNAEISDLQINVTSPAIVRAGVTASVSSLRTQVINEVWSGHGLPSAGATSVATSVTDPLAVYSLSPSNISRVDKLTIVSDNNSGTAISTSTPFVWRPTPGTSNNKLVVYNGGHTASDAEYNLGGQGQMIKALVEGGYTVVGYHMPFGGADSAGTVTNHNAIPIATSAINYLKAFIDPIVRGINQLQGEGFTQTFMTGISGGGWTTHLSSAIDTRIKVSIPVAGSLPLYMGSIGSGGRDWEQYLPNLSSTLDYTDLYVMATDSGRKQTQILNTGDTCCFYQSVYNTYTPYTTEVTNAASSVGGTWSLVWDTNNDHSYSTTSRQTVLDIFNAY